MTSQKRTNLKKFDEKDKKTHALLTLSSDRIQRSGIQDSAKLKTVYFIQSQIYRFFIFKIPDDNIPLLGSRDRAHRMRRRRTLIP